MDNNQLTTFSLIAALVVIFTALIEPIISAVLALAVLTAFFIFKSRRQ